MKRISLLVLFLLVLTSCASQKKEEREIEEKTSKSTVSTPAALGGTIHDAIANSKTLTDAQKQELTKIIDENKKKADELQAMSFKYRGVLIQELFSGSMSQKKIKILKKDIKKVEQARLKNTFETIEKISKIVSKEPNNEDFSQHLMNFERSFK